MTENISFTGEEFRKFNAFVLEGNLFDIGTQIIKWNEIGGYNGYITESVINSKGVKIKGKRYKKRAFVKPIKRIKQLLVHHSGADRKNPGVMYNVLYKERALSVHFAVEDDGVIWQFNDVIDCCKHAGKHNRISVGAECCLFPLYNKNPNYYSEKRNSKTGNLPHKVMTDNIHGEYIKVYCFTKPQVNSSLAKLYAGIWAALLYKTGNRIYDKAPEFPKNDNGSIIKTVARKPLKHIGLIGHLQCTRRKIDPAGFPWFEFEKLVEKYFYNFVKTFVY